MPDQPRYEPGELGPGGFPIGAFDPPETTPVTPTVPITPIQNNNSSNNNSNSGSQTVMLYKEGMPVVYTTMGSSQYNDYISQGYGTEEVENVADIPTYNTDPNTGAVIDPAEEAERIEDEIKAQEEADVATLQESYDMIDNAVANGLIDATTGELYKGVVANYSGTDVNFEDIIAELNRISETTISPEYDQRIDEAIAEITNAKTYLEDKRAIALESETATAEGQLESAKSSLESSGLSFSGTAGEYLGKKSALDPNKVSGELGEGTLGAYQRQISSSSQADYLNSIQDLTTESEGLLGSEQTGDLGLSEGLVGGSVGSIEEDKQVDLADTLDQILLNSTTANNLDATHLT